MLIIWRSFGNKGCTNYIAGFKRKTGLPNIIYSISEKAINTPYNKNPVPGIGYLSEHGGLF